MTSPSNEQYWAANLDAQNLGRDSEFQRELQFAVPPDWEWATARLTQLPSYAAPGTKGSVAPVLDLGAGLGVHAVHLARAGRTVVAADIALSRLQAMMKEVRPLDGGQLSIHPVRCRAECLPFRFGSLGGVVTRSVLIHTELETACAELGRVLGENAEVAIAEPLTGNPLVQLYRRTLAPKEWQSITRYFESGGQTEAVVEKHLGPLDKRRWYGVSFLAFGFQFALPNAFLWRVALKVCLLVDGLIEFLFPRWFQERAWFVTLRGRRGGVPVPRSAAPAK
jgi:SAM-dependent methyltransferase